MAEYIEREALEKNLNERLAYLLDKNGPYDYFTDGYDEAVSTVEEFLSADVAPVVHGRWEIVIGSNGKEYMVCTCCRVSQDLTGVFTYCPNCGCRMDGGDDE